MDKEQIRVKLPQRPWYGDTYYEISLPGDLDVTVCSMPGQCRTKLTKEGLQTAFNQPIGTPRISELARSKREVAVVFGDLSRLTRVSELIPYILAELRAANIQDNAIRFVAGIGMHGAMKVMDFEKKLGRETVRRFDVFNHNPKTVLISIIPENRFMLVPRLGE